MVKVNPNRIIVVAGTYDGVLAGFAITLPNSSSASTNNEKETSDDVDDQQKNKKLDMIFASPVHNGSVRSLAIGNSVLLSTGYDELLKLHDVSKMVESGQVRTPADFRTPTVAAFAPPSINCTHCLVGFGASGKLVIYKKRDWSIQHVLNGHDGGVSTIAVHPSGKLALTGGIQDGKLKLWDLERGRLAYSTLLTASNATQIEGQRKHYETVSCIVWRGAYNQSDFYAFCYGSHITVRDVASGKDLLDVELPSQVNEICFIDKGSSLFVAAACNDGSLPVLAVEDSNEDERRAIMAIGPVEDKVAGEERFKCIQSIRGTLVATATSSGVVSVYDLQGAINMITTPEEIVPGDDSDNRELEEAEDEDEELAVEIIDSALIGTGARITCLAVWASPKSSENESSREEEPVEPSAPTSNAKDKRSKKQVVVMDQASLKKARKLVHKAKKIQKKKRSS